MAKLVLINEDELAALIQDAVTRGVRDALREMQTARPTEHQLLKRGQLADYLQVTPHMVSQLVKRGCPCVGVGSDRRFRIDEVTAWMRQSHHDADARTQSTKNGEHL